MPYKLAGAQLLHPFWYHPNVSPPKDYVIWDDMITQLVKHLVARYGEEEVASWYFEVWNEPNLDFWDGAPRQKSYFELYDHTARDIKSVSQKLRVGGPATAQAAWIPEMIKHADKAHVPLDFVSTHVYGNDTADNVLGTDENVPRDQMVCRAVKMVRVQIAWSAHPDMPLIWSEYNAAYDNDVAVTDSVYMAPWLATTIAQCEGLTTMMSYWTFSDVFEEQGVVKTPFYGGFGLMAAGDIPKPSFYAMELLHHLGDQRVLNSKPNVLVTKAADGSLVVAVWNIVNPGSTGAPKSMTLQFKGVRPNAQVSISRVDQDHGDTLTLWQKMGSPSYPTQSQLEQLRQQSKPGPPEATKLSNGSLTVQLPVNGLALVRVQ
jgi:xylan 1,4-beta-xylosidase